MTAETPSPTWPTLTDIEAAAQVVQISDAEAADAAAWQQRASLRGQCSGVAPTGAHVDASALAGILSNQ